MKEIASSPLLLLTPSSTGKHPLSTFLASSSISPWLKSVVGLPGNSNLDLDEFVQVELVSCGAIVDVGDVSPSDVVFEGLVFADICLVRNCLPTAHVNAELAVPCSRLYGPVPELPSSPRSVVMWSSLFTNMPKNAEVHYLRCFDKVEIKGVMIPSVEVIKAGADYWKDYLVGSLQQK